VKDVRKTIRGTDRDRVFEANWCILWILLREAAVGTLRWDCWESSEYARMLIKKQKNKKKKKSGAAL